MTDRRELEYLRNDLATHGIKVTFGIDVNGWVDAAFIVRACNSHKAMLEALKGIIREADDPDNEKDSDLVEQIDWKGIREAVRLAEWEK